ncbi:MAG: hypothetical protein NVS9B7_24940 [Flavisolibacter sp.]
MEVHKHPHHVTHTKKWFEYLLEFLMIFLAVFLGFVAENLREHFVESKTTQGYLKTFQQELIHNKNIIHNSDSTFQALLPSVDSLAVIFYEKIENTDLKALGRLILNSRSIIAPSMDVAAYQQLVNSGGLKFIHNEPLKDSMSNYFSLIQNFENYNTILFSIITKDYATLHSLEDYHDFKGAGHVPELSPYPQLSERERRVMVAFYRTIYIKSVTDITLLRRLNCANEYLLQMVNKEIKD